MLAPTLALPHPFLSVHHSSANEPRSRSRNLRMDLRQFTMHLSLAVEQSRAQERSTHALLTVDLDGFTGIHASFGAEAASRLLVAVGHRLSECLGPNDEMAKVSGDEFNVLVDCGGNASDAWRIAEMMLHQFVAPFSLEDRHVALTACIGVALVQPHHTSAADVVRDAYAAVHRAKSEGSARRALFDDGMHEATIEQLRLAADLRHAIDRGEFRLYFQPIVECQGGRLASLEALIRWEHPERGPLAPSEFLDALVRAGLMEEVGHWVIAEACRCAVEWFEATGREVQIDINVSPTQLTEVNFVSQVLATLRRTGASRDWIAFEVTEDIELGKGDHALRTLRDLRANGLRVRIDDFGTGYSSLSYLQQLPIDGLKLDRAFTAPLGQDLRCREIVSAIIRLAHVLGLDVVAEGVEQEDQLVHLRSMGCDLVQGYLLSPPLPKREMAAWLAAEGWRNR